MLECTYEALENAGFPKESVSGKRVGVFIGANYSEYRASNWRDLDHIPSFDATGGQGAFLAGRLAYYFNLHGPTVTIDTACSSSMHALHLAVQSIRAGESEGAIVGASHLITDPDVWVSMSKLHLFSSEGRTYAFDRRATSGYARGEGAGCLVLKPLARAQADNDHIFSVITHSGISHNGRTVGIVAPSPDEQEKLIRKVLEEARIDPKDIGFFEAHGTGTKKGDPVEATAIYRAVGRYFTREEPLYIGSLKPNVGHLEGASGIVSVIKAVLMLYYGFILPNTDFGEPNADIPLDQWNMRVATTQKPWPPKRKYVCVNNFGFSGSNSMCVLSTAPLVRGIEIAANGCYSPLRLFALSANDEPALRNSVKNLGIWLEQHTELYQTTMPRNLAYTLCQRRSHLPWRVAVVASMCSDVASALNSHDTSLARAPSEPPRLAFVYTGQGAQWFAMGRELLRTHPVFMEAISRADTALRNVGADFSISEELRRDKTSSQVGQAHISQPICTAVQLALTDLLESFGVTPSAVTGHSSGEIAAAYAAGALDFESAMAAAYYRGQMIVQLKRAHPKLRGSMMAVGAGAEELAPVLEALNKASGARAVVACENSPSSTTLSGDEEAIDRVASMFQDKGVFNRKLFVDVAYHSPHMKLIAKSYLASISHLQAPKKPKASTVEFFSSLRGRKVAASELGPQYWVDNLTQSVRFSTALQRLCTENSPDVLIEVGPHAALKGPIMQTLKKLGPAAAKISYLPTLVRGQDATRTCLEMAGQLFMRGYPLDFFQINHNREETEKPELVPSLYTYPWTRQRYWYESRISHQHRLKPFARHDLLGVMADWSSDLEPTWRNVIRTEDLPWLKDYQIRSRAVFPVSGFLSMAIEAASQQACLEGLDACEFDIWDFRVSEHLFLEDDKEFEVLLTFRRPGGADDGQYEFRITSYEVSRGWLEHCTGTVIAHPASGSSSGASTPRSPEVVEEFVSDEDSVIQSDSTSSSSNTSSSATSDAGHVTSTSDADWTDEGRQSCIQDPWTNCVTHGSDATDVYDRLSVAGMSFPRSFQSLLDAAVGGSKVAAQCCTQDTASSMPLGQETPYKLHPSDIDPMLQLPLLNFADRAAAGTGSGYLPSAIRHINLRCTQKPSRFFSVHSAPEPGGVTFIVEMFSPGSTVADISIAGLGFRAITLGVDEAAPPRELCFKIDWEPFEPCDTDGQRKSHANVVIVVESEDAIRDPLVASLLRKLGEGTGISPRTCSFHNIDDWTSYFIVLSELEEALLCSMTETTLEQVKGLLTRAPGVLWVTRGATRFPTNPDTNMALGLIRTARSERSALAATLDLDPDSGLDAATQAGLIRDAFFASVLSGNDDAEMEIVEECGRLVVPRIAVDEQVNLDVHRALRPSAPYHQNFCQPGRQLRLAARRDGMSDDDLYFEDVPEVPLGDDEVEIAVSASALSQDDIAEPDNGHVQPTIARSCSGLVTRVGRNVQHVPVNSRVCALAEGSFCTHARARATSVAVIPGSLDLETASLIPGQLAAAYYAMTEVAKLQQGERVLIQLSGPVGVAAIDVARYLGAHPYVLVQNRRQAKAARRAGIPKRRVLDAQGVYLRQHLFDATQGKGMEVVLAFSGNGAAKAWECLADFGRFVEVRTSVAHQSTRPELCVNATFTSINMVQVAAVHPHVMEQTLHAVMGAIERGAMRTLMQARVLPVSELPQGLGLVRRGFVEGVVMVEGWSQVKVRRRTPKWRQSR